eukprot:1660248-Ditylum_brightwellii.AAC.1
MYQEWLLIVHNCAQRIVLSQVIIVRQLEILQQSKISEIISKRSRGGQVRYLIVLTGKLTSIAKTDYITTIP